MVWVLLLSLASLKGNCTLFFFFFMWYEHSVSVLKYLYGFLLPIRQRLKIFFYYYYFYCSGFCHTLKWISHGFTCVPHPDPPSHLPLHPIPLGLPSAPGPSAWQRLKIFNFRFFVVCLLPTSLAQIHTTPFHRQWLFPISILPFSIRNRTLRSSWYHQFSNYSNWICILINTDIMFLRQMRKCT